MKKRSIRSLRRLVPAAVALLMFLPALAAQSTPTEPEMKFGIPVKPGPMDSVLLKDYKPDVSLVLPRTIVEKARFPVIDAHTHSGMSHIRTAADVDAWVRTMDDVGVEYTVVFTGAIGDEFAQQVKLFAPHRDRFQLWCSLDTENVDDPGYPRRVAEGVERCYQMGARGIGEITDKGSGIQEASVPKGERLHIDDPRLDLAWQACARLKMPVNVHIADHPSAWQPLGPHQERTPDFQTFNLYGKDVLSYEELLARRDRLLLRNPETLFILCHLSNQGNNLAALSKVLERFPGLHLDLSARDYEIGRQPRAAAAFLAKYKDRILFGTDMERDAAMYRGWWQLLETADEFLPGRILWPYYGLDLPDPVLEALYRKNAKRLLNWTPW